jgi:hypothetical protein
VNLRPDFNPVVGECFDNVRTRIGNTGGELRFGWNIRVWPNVLLDAQFHVVYVAPDREHLDATPEDGAGADKILFLPDNVRRYTDGDETHPNERPVAPQGAPSKSQQVVN